MQSAGNEEFSYNSKILTESSFPDKLILANANDSSGTSFMPFSILKNNGYKLYVTSFINKSLVPENKAHALNTLDPQSC